MTEKNTDSHHLFLYLTDFIYLKERLYKDSINEDASKTRIVEITEMRETQQRELLNSIELVYLNTGCWHDYLEKELACLLEVPTSLPNCCDGACPYCLRFDSTYILLVSRDGTTCFLTDAFFSNPHPNLTSMKLAKLLHDYPKVGNIVYTRPCSILLLEMMYIHSTVLQLFASGFVKLNISNDKKKATCLFSVRERDRVSHYVIDSYW